MESDTSLTGRSAGPSFLVAGASAMWRGFRACAAPAEVWLTENEVWLTEKPDDQSAWRSAIRRKTSKGFQANFDTPLPSGRGQSSPEGSRTPATRLKT